MQPKINTEWIKNNRHVFLNRPNNDFYDVNNPVVYERIRQLAGSLGIDHNGTKLHHLIPGNMLLMHASDLVSNEEGIKNLSGILTYHVATHEGIQELVMRYNQREDYTALVSCVWSSVYFWNRNLVYGPGNRNDDPG